MTELRTNRRSYQRPTVTVYDIDDLWRELGPAQALTPGPRPPRRPPSKRQIPSNPLRIPPSH